MKNYTKSDVKKAIQNSGGYMTNIAKKLGCDWGTARAYVRKFKLQDLVDNENQMLSDLTEMKLMENIRNNDTTAIIFRLKTRARDRGYDQEVKIDHTTGGQPFNLGQTVAGFFDEVEVIEPKQIDEGNN